MLHQFYPYGSPTAALGALGSPSVLGTEFPGEVWDICSEEPGERTSQKRAVTSDPRFGPHRAWEIDPGKREIRTWMITVGRGREIELWRLRMIWERTARGTLPFDVPESIHGEAGEGTLRAVIVDRDLTRRYLNAGSGRFTVELEEWRG